MQKQATTDITNNPVPIGSHANGNRVVIIVSHQMTTAVPLVATISIEPLAPTVS
jgi:hypothetical protein